jgi:serine/threonine protein kinase
MDASLRVTSQTTLDQLQRFTDAAGDNAKIRGKKNDDGSITLYASTKKGTGAANKLMGGRADRQRAAQEAITTVLRGAGGGQQLQRATGHILDRMPKGELRGSTLKDMVADTGRVREQAAQLQMSRADLATSVDKALANGHPDQLKRATAELGNHIAQYMQGKTADQQLDFVLNRGDALKNQFLLALAAELPPGNGPLLSTYANADPQVKAMLDEAYTQALGKLPNHHGGGDSIVLNGVTYTKDRHLADGGFGSVDVYKAPSGHEVAVKTMKGNASPEKFDEAVREIRSHHSAQQGNPTNVVKLEGVVRAPDGGLQIAMELAGKGDVYELTQKLADKVKAGDITQQEANQARLTMIKDMLEGMRHVQETRGMIHLDVKGPNFFVDGNGVTKLGDFGTALQGTTARLSGSPVDNPTWLAPEVIKGDEERGVQVSALRKMMVAAKNAALAEVDKTLPQDKQDELRANIVKDKQARLDQQSAPLTFGITNKVDTWSVGIEAFRVLTGKPPFDGDFMSEIMDQIKTHASDVNNRVTLPTDVDLGFSAGELRDLNALIGGLLHPDPTQRTSLSDALQSPIFQNPGIGGQAARDILKGL